MFELHHLTAQEQWNWLHRREVSVRDLVEHYLARIARLDDGIGSFVTVAGDRALAQADRLDAEGPGAQPLWGLPLGDKDLVARAGQRTTYGSRVLAENVPDRSDELVGVLDSAGAVSLGTTAAPEFGMPAYTESSLSGATRNPWAPALGVGGSSGGAAAAVAAGLLPFAPGSDGGGSVRIPAAATGLVGLKPSRGLLPVGSGLDRLAGLVVPGAIARTVADAAMLLDGLAAGGPYEFATRAPNDGSPLLASAVRGEGRFQLGVTTWSPWSTEYDIRVSPEAREALSRALEELTAIGHGLEEFEPEPAPEYAAAFRTVWQAGAATLPLDDGQLELVEPLTRWLVRTGRATGAQQLAEALATLTGFERSIIRSFSRFDAVLTPALALPPPPIGWFERDRPERDFEQQCLFTPFTSFVNVAGLPAISLPVAESADGIPMGVQLIGRPGGERTLLSIGAQLERRIGWQRRHPPAWTG